MYHWKGFESYPNLRKPISRYVPRISVTDVLLLFHHGLKFCYLFSHLVKSFFLSCPSEIWPECWHIGDKHGNKQFWKLNGTSTSKEGRTFLLSAYLALHTFPQGSCNWQRFTFHTEGRQAGRQATSNGAKERCSLFFLDPWIRLHTSPYTFLLHTYSSLLHMRCNQHG